MNKKWPVRWDLLLRYRLIEVVALWEGRLTTNHLIKGFGIGRQQASKDINSYLADIAPGNLIYDKQLKGYKPSDTFDPKLTRGHVDEYLHILARSEDITFTFENLDMGFENTLMVQPKTRSISPQVLRPLVQAIRENKRVDICYIPLKDGVAVERVISPHTLVCTSLRWHIRAYCEYSGGYRDFVLSRIHGEPDINDKIVMGKSQDDLWNTNLTLKLTPDTRLSEAQANVIENDFGMIEGSLNIPTNAALIRYVLDAYNIDIKTISPTPEEQQIIVSNLDEVKRYTSF